MKITIHEGNSTYGRILGTIENNKVYRYGDYSPSFTVEGQKVYSGWNVVYTIQGNKIYYGNSYDVAYTIDGKYIRSGSGLWGNILYTLE